MLYRPDQNSTSSLAMRQVTMDKTIVNNNHPKNIIDAQRKGQGKLASVLLSPRSPKGWRATTDIASDRNLPTDKIVEIETAGAGLLPQINRVICTEYRNHSNGKQHPNYTD